MKTIEQKIKALVVFQRYTKRKNGVALGENFWGDFEKLNFENSGNFDFCYFLEIPNLISIEKILKIKN